MSHLSEELSRQLATRRLTQADLASRSGISQAQISKWVNSDQTSISGDQLSLLAPALSDDVIDQAELVRAHLLDEKNGPASDLVDVTVQTLELRDMLPKPRSKGERALHFLSSERIRNRDLNELLIDLARCLGAKL